MSQGPGRVQRAILDAISTPEASATYAESWSTGLPPGPVGVPVETILTDLYGPNPTRAQRHSVWRAIRTLRRGGQHESYDCQVELYDRSSSRWSPTKIIAVGRPRNADEERREKRRQPR
jgi:hypothetical protein